MKTLSVMVVFFGVLILFFLITRWLLSLIDIQAGVGTFLISFLLAVASALAIGDELEH